MRRGRTERERARRRLLFSLGVAVLVHALMLLVALRLRDESTGWPETITIDLRTTTTPPPTPPARPRPRRRTRIAKRSAERPPALSSPSTLRPDLPLSPNAGGAGSGAGGVASMPTAPSPIPPAPMPSPTPEVELFPSRALAQGNARWRALHGEGNGGGLGGRQPGGMGARAGLGRGEGEGEGEGPAAEKARVTRRIARDVADAQAASRVQDGLFDPYFVALEHAAKDAFHPTVGMLGGVDGDGVLPDTMNMLKTWSAAGKQFARTGSPYPDGEKPTGLVARREVRRAPGGTSGFDGLDFMNRWNSGDFQAPGDAVIVELVQRSDGVPVRATVIRSSGSRAFDRAARKAIETAATQRIAPSHGFGLGGQVIRSRWKVEAKFVTNTVALTPDPTGGLGSGFINHGSGVLPGLMVNGRFDAATGQASVDTPGQTNVITRVTLLAVYGGEAGPHAE